MWEFLRDNAFIIQTGKSRSNVPTVAGLLLFGKAPEDFLVQSTVKAEFRSNGRSAALDITGPLLLMPEKIKAFLSRHHLDWDQFDALSVEGTQKCWDLR